MSETIIIAIAAPLLSFAAAWLAYRSQRAQMDKESRAGSQRLQEEVEERLWTRARSELDKMQARLDDQDATIREQGALIMQLRQTIQQQSERISALELERDDWMRRALVAEGGKKRL